MVFPYREGMELSNLGMKEDKIEEEADIAFVLPKTYYDLCEKVVFNGA